ncbi:SPOR domain-containing protein [Rhodanobacter sp. BL-MT-08]
MKTRLLGAAVLLALLVLFVPMLFSSKPPAPGGDQAVSLAIPPAPDRDLQTKTMSLNPDAAVGAAGMPGSTAAQADASKGAPSASGQLATVNIGSTRPRDVETDPLAGKKPAPTTVTTGSGASSAEPVIPMQNRTPASVPAAKQTSVAAVAQKTPRTPPANDVAPVSGHGSYKVNLSAYASAAGAASLQRRVQALGYPVSSHAITQGGQPRTVVIAGPFETRAAAEAARLKITQSVPGVPARLQQDAGEEIASAAAPVSAPASKPAVAAAVPTAARSRAGGFAVQLAAMSSQGDATALRDKLRGAGFDGFVDSVQAGGKQLWRVRAGPQTQRADAERIRDQIKAKLGIAGNIVPVP